MQVRPANKILSVQSHVVHGYVGNKATTFPLQMLNWDVDVLNSVNFSNHTGYGKVTGDVVEGDQLSDIYEGLKQIGVVYDAILTGYIHGSSSLAAVGRICFDIKQRKPDTLWLLDPVMGDEGQMYVDEDVIPCYRNILESKKVDIITPNQFELELLLECKITDKATLTDAVSQLHSRYSVKYVVISSLFLSSQELGLDPRTHPHDEHKIYCCVSTRDAKAPIVFAVEKLDSYFTGVGDLFSALLLDRLYKSDDLVQSVNEVLTVMSKVLRVTQSLSVDKLGRKIEGKIGDPQAMKECELRVIECREVYNSAETKYEPIILI